jgi:hypothetical protein
VLAIAAASQTAYASIVTNGDFSTGDYTGWTVTGDTTFLSAGHATVSPGELDAPSGNAAYLGTNGSQIDLSQTLSTIADEPYSVSFFLQSDTGTAAPDFFTTLINGATITALSVTDVAASDFATYTATFIGTGSDKLDFAVSNDPSWFELADVSVDVPEPSTLH